MSGTPSSTHLHASFVKSVLIKNEGVNMGTWLLKVVLAFCFCNTGLGIHTSDKLDFGDTPHQSSLVKTGKNLPVKVTRTVDSITSPSEHISVSCGSTGCNTTNSNNSVETEVVVKVKTNINFDKSQEKKEVEDVSDVPIVVGYRGATPDQTPNEEQYRRYSPATPDTNDVSSRTDYNPLRPLYSDSPLSPERVYGDYGSTRRDYTPYGPLHTSSPDPTEGGYRRHGLSSDTLYRHGSFNHRSQLNGYSGPVSTTPPSYGYYVTSSLPNEYYEPASPRNELRSNYYGTSSPRNDILSGYYDLSSPRTVEINGVSSPLSVTIPKLNRRIYDDDSFRDNGDELQIPYFEHTYNKQHFGEEPPLHPVLFPKSNTFNPVEFRNIPRNKWTPSFFNGRPNKYAFSNSGSNFINPYTHNRNHPIPYSPTQQRDHGETNCHCRDQRTDDDSNPYTAASVTHHIAIQKKDPGASIDDKLAPLN